MPKREGRSDFGPERFAERSVRRTVGARRGQRRRQNNAAPCAAGVGPQHRSRHLEQRCAVIGYLPQRYDSAHDAEPLKTRFTEADGPACPHLAGRTRHFRRGVCTQPLAALSEGQKRKVRLAQLILARPNVLVLDEPTTHLDYVSVEMLEAALIDFPGTLHLGQSRRIFAGTDD